MHEPQEGDDMDSMDNIRERFAAVKQRTEHWQQDTRRVQRWLYWWRSPWSVAVVAALGLALAFPHEAQAKTFRCSAGDVQCLIDAIHAANTNGEENTIRLKAGTYTLTAAYNETPPDPNGLNGLPVVTSPLTIRGTGAAHTIIERDASAPAFRLLTIAATGTLTLTGLTLRGGRAAFFASGGGITNVGTLTLTNSILADNTSPFFAGGISNSGTVTLTNSTLTGNIADSGGGGIANVGTLTLTNSILTDNVGGDEGGGGINNRAGTVTLTNTTLTGNLGGLGGGGILNSAGTVTLTNATLTDNMARFGGGINNRNGLVTLQNTILALNTSRFITPPADDCVGVVTSLGNNLIGDPTTCTIVLQPTDRTGDPGLGAFTDNGRPGNGHIPLLKTSQAIDAGNDAICPRRDQLGQRRINIPRVGTSRCDIGAIEFSPHDEEDEHHDQDLAAAAQASQ